MRRMSFLTFLGCASFVLLLGACAQGMGDDSSVGDDQSGDTCGDNRCTGNETSTSCPADCGGGSNAVCGDGTCNGTENANTCPADCNAAASCGDGTCNGTETINTCPADCGGGGNPVCGDGTCNGTETSTSCPVDCTGGGNPVCGDGTCNGTEDSTSCPVDCTGGGGGGCGDLVCDVAAGECTSTDINCQFDCQIFDPGQCGGGGGTTSCHDVCTTGDAQDTTCGQCQSDVCANDPLCCDATNGWDTVCVSEVNDFCTGTTCP